MEDALSIEVQVQSATLDKFTAQPVTITVSLMKRLPALVGVGMPPAQVKEMAERVRSSIQAAGFNFPRTRVLVNIEPPVKDSLQLDLPIALGILAASGQYKVPEGTLFLGELSLAGNIRPIRGAVAYGKLGKMLVTNPDSAREASLAGGAAYPAETLAEVVNGKLVQNRPIFVSPAVDFPVDMCDVRGQPRAIRAMQIAAAGRFGLLLTGVNGSGKSMLARRMGTILPNMANRDALDIATVHSVAGLEVGEKVARPFRAPHHSVSTAGLVGNYKGRPGEIDLARHGVLFFDELPEFSRDAMETVQHFDKENVQIVAGASLCPCAGFGPCRCSDEDKFKYQSRTLSFARRLGIVLHCHVEPIEGNPAPAPTSATLRCSTNTAPHVVVYSMSAEAAFRTQFLEHGAKKTLFLVATTIAALDHCSEIRRNHLDEAASFLLPVEST